MATALLLEPQDAARRSMTFGRLKCARLTLEVLFSSLILQLDYVCSHE
jgi:hypothetical protein